MEKAAANGSKEASNTLDKINRINSSDTKANSENRSEPPPWQIMVGLMQKVGLQFNKPITATACINNFTKGLVANCGYTQSLFRLGEMYENGLCVQKDPETVFQLHMKAVQQNYLKAQYAIGTYYLQVKGLPQDYKKAISWFIRVALKGSLQAQFVLGNIYERDIKATNNKILFKSFNRAKAMYSLAVGRNLPIVAYRLTELYVSGFLNLDNNVFLETQNWKMPMTFTKK